MKRITWTISLMALLAATPASPQGAVSFNNRNTSASPPINAPISYLAAGGPRGDAVNTQINGAGYLFVGSFNYGGLYARAALYGGPEGTPEDRLVLLGEPVGFRSGAAAGFVNVGSNSLRIIPNVPPGSNAFVQVRAWDVGVANVNSYQEAVIRGGYLGKSALMRVTLGETNAPALLSSLQSFSVFGFGPNPTFFYSQRTATNTLVLHWATPGILEGHTNAFVAGPASGWVDVSGQPPLVIPLGGTSPPAFYRAKFTPP